MKLHLVLVLKRQDHYPCFTLLLAVILFLVSLGKGRRLHGSRGWPMKKQLNSAFLELSNNPDNVCEECLRKLERFVVLLYDRTSAKMRVNGTRKQPVFTEDKVY